MKHSIKFMNLIFILFLGCNIIEDSDIQTLKELESLKLKSYKIDQNTSKGNSSQTATLLSDSVVSINTGTGYTINRIVWYSVPGLGSLKMKYKSGATSNLKTYTSYYGDNKPYTFVVYQGDSAVEIYRFRYDPSGKLNKIVTGINPVDGLPILSVTNDTIIYKNATEIESITRRSFDPSKTGTITLEYQSFSKENISVKRITKVNFQGISLQTGGSNCPGGGTYDFCEGFMYFQASQGGGPSVANIGIQTRYKIDNLSSVELTDMKINNGGGGSCCYDYDTYYFHPSMLLRDQLMNGADLMRIYMIDWWQPGPQLTGSTNYSQNDKVTLNFNYEL